MTVVAFVAAAMAAFFLGLRAQMLKPELTSFHDAPKGVRFATFGLSVVCGAYCAAVVMGHKPGEADTAFVLALAVYGFVLWLNLFRQTSRRPATPIIPTPPTS